MRFIEDVVNGGRIDLLPTLVSQEFQNHNEVGTGDPKTSVGRGPFITEIQRVRDAFPDVRIHVQQLIAEGDLVMVRSLAEGTHLGSIGASMSTGRHAEIRSYTIYRLSDGLIAERWNLMDRMAMLQQLGVMPA